MSATDPGLPFDAMDTFEHAGRDFLCSAEQLPDGTFHATLRCRMPPTDAIRTLQLDAQRFASAREAVARARELAVQWAASHPAGEAGR